jgi:uncharacterized protein
MQIVKNSFEWDSNKGEAHKEMHGIGIEDIIEVFDARFLKLRSDRSREIRWVALDKAQGLIIAVIYAEREGLIGIISARMARTKEREIHQQRIGDTF